jgi:hypothetical protein
MEDSRIDELVKQVRTLTLQVEALTQDLRRRDSRSPSLSAQENTEKELRRRGNESSSLRHPSTEQELRRRDSRSPSLSSQDIFVRPEFVVGDRVRVLNAIKKPATWSNARRWSEAEAKTATVTRVRATQAFFTTDNGVETWRAPNNLRRIRHDE